MNTSPAGVTGGAGHGVAAGGTTWLGVFRHRDYALLWAGQLVSNVGDSFNSLALLWLVKELTGSALAMGTVMAAFSIPMVLVGPLAGVMADRTEKRTLMIGVDLVRAGLLALLAVGYAFQIVTVPLLIPFALAMGTAAAFFEPARQGSLIFLVEPGELTQANSFAMLTRQVSQLVGPVLAGLAVAAWGVGPAFWIDGISFGASAAALALMRYRSARVSAPSVTVRGLMRDLKTGFVTIGSHAVIRWVFPLAVLANFLLGPVPVLLPLYADHVSSLGAKALGYIEGSLGAGMLAGSLLVGVAGARWRKGHMAVFGFFGIALATLGFGLLDALGPALVAFGAWGFFSVMINVPVLTMVQQETPPDQQGRVFSALMAAATAAQPMSMAAGGALGDRLGVGALYVTVGVSFLGLATVASAIRPLREAR